MNTCLVGWGRAVLVGTVLGDGTGVAVLVGVSMELGWNGRASGFIRQPENMIRIMPAKKTAFLDPAGKSLVGINFCISNKSGPFTITNPA